MEFGREEKVPQLRLTIVQYAILGMFIVLAYGLWRLQVVGSDKYETMAEHNRIRTVPILAPRGKILDREGRILVDNYPSFSVLLLRDQQRNLDADIEKISSGLNMSPAEIRDRIRRVAYAPAYEPIILKDDITPDELAFIESHKVELPELETILVARRLYPKNGFLAHVIGYVGEVSEQMLNSPAYELYEPGMIVGQSGIEQQYNDILMGKDGSRRVLVNSKGKEVGRVGQVDAEPGQQLRLTIDLDMQIAAEQALGDRNGAIVAMDPRSGEILAMVSRPTFDPNDFAVHISRNEWNQLVTDPGHPLMNKAIQAQLAPGSTFKIIMSVAGLQEGIAETMHVNCAGYAVFYGSRRACWIGSEQHSAHGVVDISKGIYQSCDIFFYTLADRLGIGRIAKYGMAFGLGKKTGIDLPQEATGLMPSEEWKIKTFKEKWYAGDTISVGIGQGAVTVTPVQLARALGGIAMGGQLRRPHLAFDDEVPKQELEKVNQEYPEDKAVEIAPENVQLITDAMSKVPGPMGTAPTAAIPGVDFAGKTGSAQTMSNAAARKLGFKHSMDDNAWFVGFTPRRDPEIVVCVLMEAGEAGRYAARLAGQVVAAYVDKRRAIQRKSAELQAPKPAPAASPTAAPTPKPAAPARAAPHKAAALRRQPAARQPLDPAPTEFTGVWSASDDFHSARFRLPQVPAAQPAKAAPGLQP